MKRSKKSPNPVSKNKDQPKKPIPITESNKNNKFINSRTSNDNSTKADMKKQNKKKLINSNTMKMYMTGSSIAFFTCLHFIFYFNFKQLILPIPVIYKEAPIAANIDYYWNFSSSSTMQFLNLFIFITLLYYCFYSFRCEPELSFAYCLIILLDPYFLAHFFTSYFLFFSLIISTISFKFVFDSLTLFKRVDNKYKMMIILFVCFLNGLNLSIRFESFSIIFVQAIAMLLKAFKKKKIFKELMITSIAMIFIDLLIFVMICLCFGFPQKISLRFERIENFKDELKIYSFNKIFFALCVCSIILSFVCSFKLHHKILLVSILISAFLSIFLPIKTSDYSIQIRLVYMQFLLYICFGIIICRPRYLCVSGTILGFFVLASWIFRYNFSPYSYLDY